MNTNYHIDDLPLWQARRPLPGAKASLPYIAYALHHERKPTVGVLLLDSSVEQGAQSQEVQQLLTAMLRAIQLTATPIYLTKQQQLTRVLIMGEALACQWLGSTQSFTELRANNPYANEVIVTYHPLALIQDAQLKRVAWADLQLLAKQWKLGCD